MPSKQNDENELDEAFDRFGRRLKAKATEKKPSKDAEFRARLEKIETQAPSKSHLFSKKNARLQQLKEEFQFEVQLPQTIEELIIHLLAQKQVRGASDLTLAAADLYSQIHNTDRFKTLSSKEFQKVLKQLGKNEILQLKEIKGTLLIRLRDEYLSEDEATILDIAARKQGKVSLEQLMLSTQWPQVRVQAAIDSLLAKKMIVQKQSFTTGTRFHVSEEP